MKKLLLFAAMLFIIPAVRAAEELDEKMPVVDWEANYLPVKASAQRALAAADYLEAADLFLQAGDAHAFAWVRARHTANAAVCWLKHAEWIGSATNRRKAAKQGLELVDRALVLAGKAAVVDGAGCVHPTSHVEASKALRRHIDQLRSALEALL